MKIRKKVPSELKVLDILLVNPKPSRSIIYSFLKQKFPLIQKQKRLAASKVVEGALWDQPDKVVHALCELL